MNFARLNMKILPENKFEEIAGVIEEFLSNAAMEGSGDEFETFSNASERVVGINIPFSDALTLLEAGSVFGYCVAMSEIEAIAGIAGNWMSIHADDDSVLESP